jgi:hypothetical protein
MPGAAASQSKARSNSATQRGYHSPNLTLRPILTVWTVVFSDSENRTLATVPLVTAIATWSACGGYSCRVVAEAPQGIEGSHVHAAPAINAAMTFFGIVSDRRGAGRATDF